MGAPRQEAAVHGRRVRPGGRVEPRALARLAPAREPRARRHPVARARPQPRLPRRARRCGRSTTSTRGLLLARAQRRRQQRRRLRRAARGPGARRRRCRRATSRRCRARATASGCRAPAAGARRVNTDSALLRRHATSATSAASRPRPIALARPAVLGRAHAAAARRAVARA